MSELYKVLEASEIGWPPGHWPMILEEDGEEFHKQTVHPVRNNVDPGTDRVEGIMIVVYASATGKVIHVLND